MSNVVLSLGGVQFQDMEIPEKIRFGGGQRVATQNLIGGGRVVSVLGLDDGVISFAGIFSGSDAVIRAQELDAARALGAQIPLIWNGFFYNVVIEHFIAEYRKPTLIPFSITCLVVLDNLAASVAALAPVADLVAADISTALGLSGQAGVSLQSVSYSSLSGYSAVQAALAGNLEAAGGTVNSALAMVRQALTPDTGVSALGQLVTASGQLAGATRMQGFINRAVVNIGAL